MTTSIKPSSMLFFSAAILLTVTAGGEPIYRWLGADGATHFSETPPDADPASVEILEVVSRGRLSPPAQDYQSVLDVAKDIESGRLERERLRLENKKLLLQSRQLRQSAMIQQEYDDDYPGVRVYYSPYYRYGPPKRHYYHRPVNPAPHLPHRYGERSSVRHAPPNARVYLRQ